MRSFLAGAIVGALVVGAAWALVRLAGHGGPAAPESEPRGARDSTPAPERTHEPPRVRAPAPRAERPTAPADETSERAPFAEGEAILRIGEGYVFGESAPLPRSGTGRADIVCLDVRDGGAVLRCAVGGARPDVPLGAVNIPKSAREAATLAADAPAALEPADLGLNVGAVAKDPGFRFVRAASGTTFKVWVAEVRHDADALRREVKLGWTEVPARPGGGTLTAVVATSAKDAPTLRDLESLMAAGDAIPNASFTDFLQGDYERLSSMPAEISFNERKYLVVDDPLATSIEFNRYSGLVAGRGIAQGGKVRIRSYTGVAVRGEMAGRIDVESYAYIHVTGDLTGRLDVRSYATVVIDGDLRGEVNVSSYTTLLLRGQLLGKLTISSSGSAFWFQRWMGRSAAEALAGGGNDLHLFASDLAEGTHKDVPGWSTVTVGEEAWKLVAR